MLLASSQWAVLLEALGYDGKSAAFLSWESVAVKARCLSFEILRGRWCCNAVGADAGAEGPGAALRLPFVITAEDGEGPFRSWLHAPAPVPAADVAAAAVRRPLPRPHWAHRARPLSTPFCISSSSAPPITTSLILTLLDVRLDETATAAPVAEPVILCRCCR